MEFKGVGKLDKVLSGLFETYEERVSDVKLISSAMKSEGIIKEVDEIVNDHIAFRTLGVSNLGIQSFEKIFLHYGYVKKDYFHFESKKLNAYWYAPPSPVYPRVFISELRVDDLSSSVQKIIKKYTSSIDKDPVDLIDVESVDQVLEFFTKSLWEIPSLKDYLSLFQESEYASWVIYNRYYLNHYTISIHALKVGYNTLEEFNRFLNKIGVDLNNAGGVIKISEDGLLLQSSTVAERLIAEFSGGDSHVISGSYVEFAERRVLPEYKDLEISKVRSCHRREGFETGNADKIFESTYSTQIKK